MWPSELEAGMKMRLLFLVLVLAWSAVFGACGDPIVKLPPALEVSYLPLDGAVDVALDMAVEIYFSAAVDPASVAAQSVILEEATLTAGVCGSDWTAVAWEPAVDSDQSQRVRIGDDQNSLSADSCYRIVLTTGVKGVDYGPMMDLGLQGREGVAAEAIFMTGQD